MSELREELQAIVDNRLKSEKEFEKEMDKLSEDDFMAVMDEILKKRIYKLIFSNDKISFEDCCKQDNA